ncbi:hypothetical protein GUY60_34475, partial [Streptomyces sp. YC537]|nr:hypothetical protein [Streptomyces boluensis]
GGRRALAVLLPLTLLGVLADGVTAPEARAAASSGAGAGTGSKALTATAAGAGPQAVLPGAVPTVVTTSRFSPEGFLFAGVEEIDTEKGPLKVMVLSMKAATLTDYVSTTRDPSDAQQVLGARNLELRGNVKLYLRTFHGCIEGSPVCVTFSPETLPTPPVVPPFVFLTRVRAEQALVTTDSLNVDGLRIQSTDEPAPDDSVPEGPLPGEEGAGSGGQEDDRPGGGHEDGDSGGEPDSGGTPGSGDARDGVLTLREPRREATDVPWCEKVTLTVGNTGGRAVSDGTVVFETDIVGALGVTWSTETSRHALPGTLDPGERRTHTWRVCVPERHAPAFLFGRHLEHRATAVHPDGRSEQVDVPRS